jgi:hypothetical protein
MQSEVEMDKIRNFWKNKKGMTLVWGAFFLVLLLMLAGMAIDIGYMYFVKNQLQVAADSAALAGAAKLDGTTSVAQDSVREEAWKFACRNTAGGTTPGTNVNSSSNNVYLANNSSASCDSPPSGSMLNGGNDPAGDIVLGNWNTTDPSRLGPPDCRFLPAPGCPALSPAAVINAVKVVARRTGADAVDNISSGNNSVNVFLGQIFRMIGTDWSLMSAVSSAIASRPPRASSFVAMGSTACDIPITSNSDCVGLGNPYPCCTGPGTATCRVLSSSGSGSCCDSSCTTGHDPLDPKCSCCWKFFGWTGLSSNLSSSTFDDKVCTDSPYEDICGPACTPGGQIYGVGGVSTGAAFADYQAAMYDPSFDAGNKEITGGNVTGWSVIFPWTTGLNPIQGSPDCGGGGGGAYSILGYVKVHITAVCVTPGSTGHGCSGFHPHGYPTSTPPGCTGYPNASIVIDSISCTHCGSDDEPGLKAALVK